MTNQDQSTTTNTTRDELRSNVKARVTSMPNLSTITENITEDVIDKLVDDAIMQAFFDGFKEHNIEMGASLLTAHFCNVINNQNSNVAKEQLGTLSREYFDRAGSDDFLVEYNRLKRSLSSATIRFM